MALRDEVSDRAEGRLGSVLKGKWRLDSVIGVGGMATVFAATHRNQSRVAIKMLHPEIALDAEVTGRFLREGYLANAVGHPGTVAVLDDDVTADGVPFLVMELLEGESLDARAERKGGRLTQDEVLSVIDQVLDVLITAHAKGVVHRDLKPENLFLTNDGRLKVLDFGIARLRERSQNADSTTRAGSLLGTPAFMAPEQARGRWEEVDGRTDVWAVGATLFTLLTGRYVHQAETMQEQLVLAATRSAPSLASVVIDAPEALLELVARALCYDKNGRFESAAEMRAALRRVLGASSRDTPLTLPRPSLSRGESGPTLVAPPEVTSAITGRLDTLNTNSPFARDRSNPPPGRSRLRWLVLGGLAGVFALGVASAFVSKTTSVPPAVALATGLRPRLDVLRTVRPKAKPAELAVTVQHPEPAPPRAKPVPRRGRPERHNPEPSKEPASSSLTGTTKPGGEPAHENPFDRRH